MSNDPYEKKNGFREQPYYSKRIIEGQLVVVLQGTLQDRGLQLIKPKSRALKAGEIHELIFTDEDTANPGEKVDNIAYLGFMEVERGSVAVVGDPVTVNGVEVGKLAGFDETHMPNHINIVIKSSELKSGRMRSFKIEDKISLGQ